MKLISAQCVSIVGECLREPGRWRTGKEIAEAAGTQVGTTLNQLVKLMKLGVVEQTKAHGGFRYRAVGKPAGPAVEFLARFEAAKAALDPVPS